MANHKMIKLMLQQMLSAPLICNIIIDSVNLTGENDYLCLKKYFISPKVMDWS